MRCAAACPSGTALLRRLHGVLGPREAEREHRLRVVGAGQDGGERPRDRPQRRRRQGASAPIRPSPACSPFFSHFDERAPHLLGLQAQLGGLAASSPTSG
jgi:hypothetical protein